MAAAILDGRFERVAKREHAPLGTFWENKDKLPGEKNNYLGQIYNVNTIADYAVAKIKRDGGKVTDKQWNEQKDPAIKIEENLALIEQHIDRRIQLFFMQLICCYRTLSLPTSIKLIF